MKEMLWAMSRFAPAATAAETRFRVPSSRRRALRTSASAILLASRACGRSVSWWITTSGWASATTFRRAPASKTSTTTGSTPISRSMPALFADRVLPTTRHPSATRSGPSRRPMAPDAPARKMHFFMFVAPMVDCMDVLLRRLPASDGPTLPPPLRGAPDPALQEPALGLAEELLRRLPAELTAQVRDRLRREEALERVLRFLHEEVDPAHPRDAPAGRLLAEQGAVAADLGALEEGAVRIGGFEDVPQGDLLGRPGQPEHAADAFDRVDDPRLLEPREDLREESLGELLEAREITRADGLRSRRQDEERMQRVLR